MVAEAAESQASGSDDVVSDYPLARADTKIFSLHLNLQGGT